MLEGNVLDYPSALTSQPSPEQAAAPTHNGYSVAVREVRFCGGTMKIPGNTMAPNKSEPQYIRPLVQPSRAPSAKAVTPVTQRRRSAGGGRKGANALLTTPIPTPIPADVSSKLKNNAADRLKFSDRLNALLHTSSNNDFEDDKDPYAFVDSAAEVNRLQQQKIIPQNVVKNNVVRKTPASITANTSKPKPKKRKTNNITTSTPSKNSLIQQNLQQQNLIKQQIVAKQQEIVARQQQIAAKQIAPKPVAAKPQVAAQQPVATKPQVAAKPQVVKQQIIAKQQQQQQIVQQPQNVVTQPTSTSHNASFPQNNSILRNVKITEQINNRRPSLDKSINNQPHANNNLTNQQNVLARIPVTLPAPSLPTPPQLSPLIKSVVTDEEKITNTTMNQLQARIARNKVIGKHRNKIVTSLPSSHSQSIIANPSNVISSQQLTKLKERSLLEEQLLLGMKNDKLTPSSLKQLQQNNPQPLKTVTQHFTFPMKNAGSVVTYKKPAAQSSTSNKMDPKSGHSSNVVMLSCKKNKKSTTKIPKSSLETMTNQLVRMEHLRLESKAYRQDLFPLGLEMSDSEDDADMEEGGVFQRHWFLKPPCEENCDNVCKREQRLHSVKSTIRRKYLQLRRAEAHFISPSVGIRPTSPDTSAPTVRALITAARSQPNRTASLIMAREEEPSSLLTPSMLAARARRNKHRTRQELFNQSKCCYTDCTATSLPCARHCIRHIMYNVDQLLFEHCTAKYPDNTQCCVPVFDIMHELPLCLEHGQKRDNYTKMNADLRPKRARRKAKPSAMTRPSKRGKKKKKGGPPQPQIPVISLIPQQQALQQQLQQQQLQAQQQQQQQQQQQLEQQRQQQQQQQQQQLQQQIQQQLQAQQLQQQLQAQQQQQQQLQAQQQQQQQQQQLQQQLQQLHSPLVKIEIQQPLQQTTTLQLGQHVFLSQFAQQHSPPEIVEAQGMVPMMMGTEDSLSQSQPDTGSMLADAQVCSDSDNDMAGLLEEVEAQGEEALSPGTMLTDELPLADELAQQATRLLDDHDDLASVLCQIPADTLNELFNGEKTGAYEPTREETEELERALEAVDKDVKSLEKMSRQQNGPSNPPNTNILPSEIVDSILGPNLMDDHTLSMALRHHQGGVAKEEVVVDSSHLLNSQQLLGQQNLGLTDSATGNFSADLHSQVAGLMPSQDSMIQLDAAVFPPDAMVQLVPDLQGGGTYVLHQSGGSLHQSLQQGGQQVGGAISFPSNTDVSSLLHHNLLPQMPLMSSDQMLLNPAVYGGGAAPPPTPNSVHQPAVANTPPFHHQNGYLIGQQGSQYDAKAASAVVFTSPLPSAPSPAMSPAQFSPATPNSVLSSMATHTPTDS